MDIAPRIRGSLAGPLALLCVLWFCHGTAASGATITVSRVQIFLSDRTKSELITLKNVSDAIVRFQLSVSSWAQSPQGEMVLATTRDIVFFPPLFSLKPGEERNIRVGRTTPTSAIEKTYRLFIEELPKQEGAAPGPPGQVEMRTRLGVPIFLRPPKEVAGGRVDTIEVRDGNLSFALHNTGTVHFLAQAIRVIGYGAAGETILEGKLDGWYVLAGGTRLHDLELPSDKCPLLRTITVEVQTPLAAFTQRVDLSSVGCRP